VLIEQITYTMHPGKAPALIEAYESQGLAVITASLGRLIAFVTAEVGAMDEISHLWAFADAADREARHNRLAADPAWRTFTSTYGHLLVARRNQIWRAASFSPGL
jgi:hypothetical protein